MQQQHSRTKRVRVITGALIGAIVSLGVVADSASAAAPTPTSVTIVEGEQSSPGWFTSMRSGIRW